MSIERDGVPLRGPPPLMVIVRHDACQMKICGVPYPFDEFAEHFEALEIVRDYEYVTRESGEVFIGTDRSLEAMILRIYDYMCQHYDRDIAMEKAAAFGQMVTYIAKHYEDFNIGTLAVIGESNDGLSMISERLLRAVHHAYMNITDEELRGHGPPPEKVIRLAETDFKDYK